MGKRVPLIARDLKRLYTGFLLVAVVLFLVCSLLTEFNPMTLMANGMAGNTLIDSENEDYGLFYEALEAMCIQLARMIAADGEGASRLLVCKLTGAKDEEIRVRNLSSNRVIHGRVVDQGQVEVAL